MPISVLFWILVIAAGVAMASLALAWLRNKNDDIGDELVQMMILCSVVMILTAPNLLWYKSVRDVMFVLPDPVEQSVEKPKPATVEVPVELIANPALMVQ
jgi:glucan phosphoethanolaminetransferase (alkaline phosphatase superfamily)